MDTTALLKAKSARDNESRGETGKAMMDSSSPRATGVAPGLSAEEISLLLRAREERGQADGFHRGWSEAWDEARRDRQLHVQREATSWVSVTLEVVERELRDVHAAATAAVAALASVNQAAAKDPRNGSTGAAATRARKSRDAQIRGGLEAVTRSVETTEAVAAELRDRLVGLRKNVERDGITA